MTNDFYKDWTPGSKFLLLVVLILLSLALSFWFAYVILIVYNWFFPSWPALTIFQVWVVLSAFRLATNTNGYKPNVPDEKVMETFKKQVSLSIFNPLAFLAVAWVVKTLAGI